MEVHRVDELEALTDHLHRIDLVEARPVVAEIELTDLGEELALALLRVPHAQIGEAPRKLVDVLVRGVDEEAGQLRHVVFRERPDRAEVDETDRARFGRDEDVRGVRVAVEEAVPEDHRHPGVRDPVGEIATLLDRRRQHVDVGELDPVDPLERQHARARDCQ